MTTTTADLRVVRTAFTDVVELIPQQARTPIYVGSVAVAVVALAAQRMVAIWLPGYRDQVDATVAEILPWVLLVIGVLATAYRPTRGSSPGPVPMGSDMLDVAQAQGLQAQTIQTLVTMGWSRDDAAAAVASDSLELLVGAEPGDVAKRFGPPAP